jgi:hypothetical protein
LEYIIRNIYESQGRLDLKGRHQLLAQADNNLLGKNVHPVMKNIETSLHTSDEAGWISWKKLCAENVKRSSSPVWPGTGQRPSVLFGYSQ